MGAERELLNRPARYLNERHRWLMEVAATYEGDDCLPWPFTPGPAGYGRLSIGYKQTMASHVVLELTGRSRPEIEGHHGAVALHSCDNPPCCNPRHLRWGTQLDNVADMHSKRRTARGEAVTMSKLTEQQVRDIRTLSRQGHSRRSLSERYGVSKVAIGHIINHKTWKHVRCVAEDAETADPSTGVPVSCPRCT